MNTISLGSNLSSRQNMGKSIFAGNMPLMNQGGLKSTQEKQQRMQKAAAEINFFEKQKENLKTMECETVEEIAKKLDKFHNYEEQIAAVKMSYNNEQVFHAMDEAQEKGEQIAEAAEKMEAKTPEERAEEARKEALGIEEGVLSEAMDELQDAAAELLPEEMDELLPEDTEELMEGMEQAAEQSVDNLSDAGTVVHAGNLEYMEKYKPIDIRV